MTEVMVVGRVKPEGMAILEARDGLTVRVIEESDPAAILDAAATATAILVRTAPIGADVIGAAAGLRVVSRHGGRL